MSRVVVIGAFPRSLINFRGEFLAALVRGGHVVTAMAAAAEPGDLAALAALGVHFRAFPVSRTGLNPVADLRTLLAIRAALTDVKPEVVLAYTIKPVVWTGIALRNSKHPRFYALITGLGYAFHGTSVPRRALTIAVQWLYRKALARATGIIFQNLDNRDAFIAKGIVNPRRCAVVDGSGVDIERFSPAPLPAAGMVFLTIGRMLGEKGFREYADAARIVKSRHPSAVFRLVGPEDASPDGIPATEIRGWQAQGILEWRGSVEDVRPEIAACHVFVLPSYHEGLPRTVLEAMAMGRPIVTTDVPGCRETVRPGENGFLVPSADPEALAERLEWFLTHPHALSSMGRRSRELAVGRFDVRRVNDTLLDLMELR